MRIATQIYEIQQFKEKLMVSLPATGHLGNIQERHDKIALKISWRWRTPYFILKPTSCKMFEILSESALTQLWNKITPWAPWEPLPAFSLVHQRDLWVDFRLWYLILWCQIQWNQACSGWVCLAPDVGDIQFQKGQSRKQIYSTFLIVKQALRLSGSENSRVALCEITEK